MSRHIGHALRFPGVLPQGLDALVVLGPRFELESIESVQHDSETLVLPAGHEVTPAAGELRRSVMRRAAGAHAGSQREASITVTDSVTSVLHFTELSGSPRRGCAVSRRHGVAQEATSPCYGPNPELFQAHISSKSVLAATLWQSPGLLWVAWER